MKRDEMNRDNDYIYIYTGCNRDKVQNLNHVAISKFKNMTFF